jgi:hypothetical protein
MIVDRIAKDLTSLPTELTETGRCCERETRRFGNCSHRTCTNNDLPICGQESLFRMKGNQCLHAYAQMMRASVQIVTPSALDI